MAYRDEVILTDYGREEITVYICDQCKREATSLKAFQYGWLEMHRHGRHIYDPKEYPGPETPHERLFCSLACLTKHGGWRAVHDYSQ